MNAAQKAARKLTEARATAYYVQDGAVFRLRPAKADDLAALGVVAVPGAFEVHEAMRQIRAESRFGTGETGVERVAKSSAALESMRKEMADPAKALAWAEDCAAWFVAGCDAMGVAPDGTPSGSHQRMDGIEMAPVRYTLRAEEEDPDAEVPVLSVDRLREMDVMTMGAIVMTLGGLVERLKPFRPAA